MRGGVMGLEIVAAPAWWGDWRRVVADTWANAPIT